MAYKYWRIQHIINRVMPPTGVTASELYFVTKSGVLSNNPTRISSNTEWRYNNENHVASNLVDGKNTTRWETKAGAEGGSTQDKLDAYIQYVFEQPEDVTHIKLQMRDYMGDTWGQEWQIADIYVSDNGTDWLKYGRIRPRLDKLDLSMHTVDVIPLHLSNAYAVDVSLTQHSPKHTGYIAGTSDGIVTINGLPAKRMILVMDALSTTHEWIAKVWSLDNGHYYIPELDPNKLYAVMARDLPPNGIDTRYEPFAWDYVQPATDLTISEQRELWESWKQ